MEEVKSKPKKTKSAAEEINNGVKVMMDLVNNHRVLEHFLAKEKLDARTKKLYEKAVKSLNEQLDILAKD
jgi:hypothetical protein